MLLQRYDSDAGGEWGCDWYLVEGLAEWGWVILEISSINDSGYPTFFDYDGLVVEARPKYRAYVPMIRRE